MKVVVDKTDCCARGHFAGTVGWIKSIRVDGKFTVVDGFGIILVQCGNCTSPYRRSLHGKNSNRS
jgi:hypothetical protein